jgi:hypothetical protein
MFRGLLRTRHGRVWPVAEDRRGRRLGLPEAAGVLAQALTLAGATPTPTAMDCTVT